MKLKSAVIIGVCLFVISPQLAADVYMKSRAMNGMAEMESWTSGKKQRTSAQMPMAGEIVTITRADKGVQWEINTSLKIYQEKPLAISYTGGDAGDTDAAGQTDSSAEEGLSTSYLQKEEGECTTASAGERQIAGYKAAGITSTCGGGQSMTLWIAEANQGKLKEIKKELDAFQAAQTEAMYADYPEKERKKMIELMQKIGTAMAQGLMGMPDPKDLPDGIPLGMESGGRDENGEFRSMPVMEVTAIDTVPSDPSRYEVPPGFTLTENIHEAMARQMLGGAANGDVKISDMLGSLGGIARQMGLPADEMDAPAPAPEEVQMMDELGQGTAQFVQAQMALQGVQGTLGASEPSARAPLPTDAPVEAWQQGLYSQTPNQGNPAAANGPYAAPAQGTSNAYPQGRAPQRQAQPLINQESLQQVQQILGTVQGIAQQFQGGGYGDYTGGMEQFYNGYGGYSQEYNETYSEESAEESGDYYAE